MVLWLEDGLWNLLGHLDLVGIGTFILQPFIVGEVSLVMFYSILHLCRF